MSPSQLLGQAKDDAPFSKSSTVSQKLKNIFKEVHWSHDVFILRTKRRHNEKMQRVPTVVKKKKMRRDIRLTFWQQSMNSSMVTTPSLFLSIFCWGRKDEKCFLKPLNCDWHLQYSGLLPTAHLPERILLHADEASPLWGQGMCIFPSCRRWPSWCLAFPTTRRKGSVRTYYKEERIHPSFTSNEKKCRYFELLNFVEMALMMVMAGLGLGPQLLGLRSEG